MVDFELKIQRSLEDIIREAKVIDERIIATHEQLEMMKKENFSPALISVVRQSLACLGAKKDVYSWLLVR